MYINFIMLYFSEVLDWGSHQHISLVAMIVSITVTHYFQVKSLQVIWRDQVQVRDFIMIV